MKNYKKQNQTHLYAEVKVVFKAYFCTALEVSSLLKHSGIHRSRNLVAFSSAFSKPEIECYIFVNDTSTIPIGDVTMRYSPFL